jgi:uncharacterized protein (DUF1697 family)
MFPNGGIVPVYLAFLRAINVGGRTVKMTDLKRHLEEAGHAEVSTFIASGNVILSSSKTPAALEKQLESDLEKALGYRVDVFVRTTDEIKAIAKADPFQGKEGRVHIAFLKKAPPKSLEKELEAFEDDLLVEGRELYWRCPGQMQDSKFSGAALEKLLKGPATLRNRNTIDRVAQKL